ncbi:hypothetical protein LOZ65_002786 [Ophidiomyces ophidiicola]|nr:hypothetical protein LOZ65_002786 [Ophidiomyces ophidiicola]
MSRFWHRLLPQQACSKGNEDETSLSSKKTRLSRRKSISHFFIPPTKNPSDASDRHLPVEKCDSLSTIAHQEMIPYPRYNVNDPRHNPEAVNISRNTFAPVPQYADSTSQHEIASRPAYPKDISPSKSLRRVRSNLRSLAGSVRLKSFFNRREIPSFIGPTLSEHDESERELSAQEPQKDAFVHRSLAIDIPSCSVMDLSDFGSPPLNNSPDNFEPNREILLYEPNSSPIQGTVRVANIPTISLLNTNSVHQPRSHDISACHLQTGNKDMAIRQSHPIRKYANISDASCNSANSPDFLSQDDLFHLELADLSPVSSKNKDNSRQPATPPLPLKFDMDLAHTNANSTGLKPPLKTYHTPAEDAGPRHSLEPGIWKTKSSRVSQISIRTPSECNTEFDSNFGTDLCRTSCYGVKTESTEENNPLLMPWLASMENFGHSDCVGVSHASDRSMSPKSIKSLKCSPPLAACDCNLVENREEKGNKNEGLAAASGNDSITISGGNTRPVIMSEPHDHKNDRSQPSALKSFGSSNFNATKCEWCQNTAEQPSTELKSMVEAVDRDFGLEIDLASKENRRPQSVKMGLSESQREEQFRLKRNCKEAEIMSRQYLQGNSGSPDPECNSL